MKKRVVFFTAVILFLISCSGTAPVIDDLKWRVLYRDDGENRFEELSLFVRGSDPDGVEDLASISVIAGSTGLIWRYPAQDWIPAVLDEVEWIGLPALIPLDEFRLPDVLYTLTLEDLAGRKDEISFRPDPDRPAYDEIKWPVAEIRNGSLLLRGQYGSGSLILRDEGFTAVEVFTAKNGSPVNLDKAAWWELWISLTGFSGGFRLGPYPVSTPDPE